ncbi:coilin-like isoform X2 [Salvia splendens]|uniref:coilin-like isoform X2 n=1 Tax=Salvia splendens TaxID=180675 RepID=UPI001C260CBC|nr:coilin-like isoform X2 [Salvia splendens]
MDLCKRIRVVFKDDDILSDTQKLEGLSRSWILLQPRRLHAVSDLASHLLHAFRLHESCPNGLLLSISGFALPSFISTSILKDNEIISVKKRKHILSIEGNDAANDVQKLKHREKRPVDGGVLLLANEEFEKEKGGYESDESKKVSEDGDDDDKFLLDVVENSSDCKSKKKNRKRKVAESEDDEVPLEIVEDSACLNSRKKNCKRKSVERLEGNKEKKQRSVVTGNASSDVCKEKKDASVAGDNVENKDGPAKRSDKNNDVAEPGEERTVDVQENDNETDDAKISPKETKKAPSRSARRKTKKRRWLREMANIQKKNATCESEGLLNWKEDQAKADRKKTDGQWNGQQKRKKYQADAERNKADGQLKGLWKLSSPSNGGVKGKKHNQHNIDDILELPKQNGDVCKQKNENGDVQKQQNQNDDKHDQLTQMSDTLEQPSHSLHEQSGQSSPSVQECTNKKCDVSNQSNHKSTEEDEVVPIEIRPGHIRFEPLEEEEAMQQDHAPLETFNWNGITSKKKGQQWGKENRRFTPINDYRTNKEDFETPTKEKRKQPNEGIDFDKLPPLPGLPKEGDLIAYRVLELSSTWTPELSAHRVGKVSWYNVESKQTMLLPVPEYPIISEEEDDGEAAQLDTSLYKEDGSLEIYFSALVDVRVLISGGSKPGNKAVACVNEASTNDVNALKTALPGTSGEPTAEPSPDTQESDQGKEAQLPSGEIGGGIWDQLSEALKAKKEQLSKENGWGSTPKKVVVSHENSRGKNEKKVQASPGSNLDKKPQMSQENSWGKQNIGSKSWSYKALRGSGLGQTMALLRSKRDTCETGTK